mgnify:CR=1 FL=1
MPNKQQGLLAFFILQETASILRMNISVILFFSCLNAGKGGLRKQMIPELARHKRKETLCQSKELRIL